MTVLQPGHDSRVPWPSTCLLGCFTPKLPSKEGPVDPRRSILCSTPGVAVVGKFRSRIRLLQFSTRKITPHGNVYISSAIRPIGFVFFCFLVICMRNQSGDRLPHGTPGCLTPLSDDPPSGTSSYGSITPCQYEILALRGPNPHAPKSMVTPGPSSPAGPGIYTSVRIDYPQPGHVSRVIHRKDYV